MRVLLDECLPRPLKDELPGHEVLTVPEAGWRGKTNGELLTLASGRYEAFITVDAGIEHEQNLAELRLGVVALKARSNRMADLHPLMPRVREVLRSLKPGEWIRVEG